MKSLKPKLVNYLHELEARHYLLRLQYKNKIRHELHRNMIHLSNNIANKIRNTDANA